MEQLLHMSSRSKTCCDATLPNKRLRRQGFLQQESSQQSVSVAQGAVSHGAGSHMEQAVAHGAGSVRTWSSFRSTAVRSVLCLQACKQPTTTALVTRGYDKTFPPQLFACRREKSPPPQRPASAVVSVIASPAPIISANAAMPLTTVRFILNLQSSELGAIRIRTSWLWA